MSLRSQLDRWQAAGLIDAGTAERIEAHEAAQRRPIGLYALAALGGGTIALGIISLVAANWDAIGPRVKLGLDLALGIALAAASYYAAVRALRWATEVLVTVLYGFTLASLSLVGQIYQLDTPEYQALCLWSAVTLPLVLLGRSHFLAALVLLGLVTTHGFAFEALFDAIEGAAWAGRTTDDDLVATLLFTSPLLYAVLARVPWLVRERPHYAVTVTAAAWSAIAIGGFALQFLWYESVSEAPQLQLALATTAVLAGGFVWALPRLYPQLPLRARQGIAALFALAWIALVLSTAFNRDSLDVAGALLQIAWLGLLSWTCLHAGRLRTFNLLTAALALRIVVVYFEVFHSLLSTGMGLITGGVLTLLMAWLWRRQTRKLATRLAPGDAKGASDAA
ncbi:MAG TPA: DUF2157 domain-containing protein [Polyangiales bacterium]|nr:DUF2157 domain-containing protein [Polyangiales bacterium]